MNKEVVEEWVRLVKAFGATLSGDKNYGEREAAYNAVRDLENQHSFPPHYRFTGPWSECGFETGPGVKCGRMATTLVMSSTGLEYDKARCIEHGAQPPPDGVAVVTAGDGSSRLVVLSQDTLQLKGVPEQP